MKIFRFFLGLVVAGLLFTSCYRDGDDQDPISLEDIMTNYDIWYVDFNRTSGYGDVPFISKAFTLTFQDGRMYANNNLVGIGFGNLYGKQIGTYNTHNDVLSVNHSWDGSYNFEVIVDNLNSIRLYNSYENVTYYLEGYDSDTFDFDQVFYDNIEYLLQEYKVWANIYTSMEGEINDFDYENFLAFTPENITTFYSSQDNISVPIDEIFWDFEGRYEVFDINGYNDKKELELRYSGGFIEEFEMTILNDETIELYHYNSGTTYEFEGWAIIEYKNLGKASKINSDETDSEVNSEGRKRFKVNRKSVERRSRDKMTQKKGVLENHTSKRGRNINGL